MIKEYEALRAEILAAHAHRHQIWSYGAAAVAVLLAGALAAISQRDRLIGPSIMAVVVPILNLAVLNSWVQEVIRGRRASWYLIGLEKRVNDALRFEALQFEHRLRIDKTEQMRLRRGHYGTTRLFFLGTGLAAAFIGARVLLTRDEFVSIAPCWMWLISLLWTGVPVFGYWRWYRGIPDFQIWDDVDLARKPWPPAA